MWWTLAVSVLRRPSICRVGSQIVNTPFAHIQTIRNPRKRSQEKQNRLSDRNDPTFSFENSFSKFIFFFTRMSLCVLFAFEEGYGNEGLDARSFGTDQCSCVSAQRSLDSRVGRQRYWAERPQWSDCPCRGTLIPYASGLAYGNVERAFEPRLHNRSR